MKLLDCAEFLIYLAFILTLVERQAAVAAAGTIATVGQRELQRSAALGATGAVEAHGSGSSSFVTYERSAAVGGAGAVTASGVRELARAAALGGVGAVAVAGSVAATFERAVALAGTGQISATVAPPEQPPTIGGWHRASAVERPWRRARGLRGIRRAR